VEINYLEAKEVFLYVYETIAMHALSFVCIWVNCKIGLKYW